MNNNNPSNNSLDGYQDFNEFIPSRIGFSANLEFDNLLNNNNQMTLDDFSNFNFNLPDFTRRVSFSPFKYISSKRLAFQLDSVSINIPPVGTHTHKPTTKLKEIHGTRKL
jgi:hypothetical protein